MQDFLLPETMGRAIESQYGKDGRAWVVNQQSILRELFSNWSLDFERFADAGLPINAVCHVRQNDRLLVLKTGYPEPELFTEIEVLKLWRGRRGCVQLVDVDEETGVMLMERIVPGTHFRSEPVSARSTVIPLLFGDIPINRRVEALPTYEQWLSRAFTRYRESGAQQLMAVDSIDQRNTLTSCT